jgi:hypothetical protein
MALNKQFARKLDQLWQRRTTQLRALVVPRGAGKPPSFTNQVRERLVEDLLDLASRILVRRHARAAFDDIVRKRDLRFLKGRGHRERGQRMVEWAGRTLKGPIVYSFWNRKRCLYVGKGKTWRRLRSYEKSIYLAKANSLEVYSITSRSHLGKAECLATHLFEPDDRKVRPAKVKWGKACPVCRKHDLVREELRGLFRMR